jgi:hypothetical protein
VSGLEFRKNSDWALEDLEGEIHAATSFIELAA